MTLETIVNILRSLEPSLRAQGVASLYLFGSHARDQAKLLSDVDLAFEVDVAADDRFSLIDQSRIQRQLVEALSAPVDFVEHSALRPNIAKRAKEDFLKIF